jgi:hypothetical protein
MLDTIGAALLLLLPMLPMLLPPIVNGIGVEILALGATGGSATGAAVFGGYDACVGLPRGVGAAGFLKLLLLLAPPLHEASPSVQIVPLEPIVIVVNVVGSGSVYGIAVRMLPPAVLKT